MKTLQHRFLEFIPQELEDNILYVSIEYCTTAHLCMCGCGNKVITPLAPTSWKLTFDGKTISLYPSIGNWNFECQSHYWISNNKVKYVEKWSRKQIENGRLSDVNQKLEYYGEVAPLEKAILPLKQKPKLLKRLRNFFGF